MKFQVEIHAIPGNDERTNPNYQNYTYSGHYVHVHNNDLIRIFFDWINQVACLGHDLQNDKGVHENVEVQKWVESIRHYFYKFIPDNAFLILGHTHEYCISEDNLSICIRPFSADLNQYYFGLLQIKGDIPRFTHYPYPNHV